MQSAKGRALQPIQAVLRARVSNKEQEEEGFSLPAQIRPLQEYAARNGFVIVQEFIDVESAKTGGRAGFNEMITYLKKHHATCRTILVEKTDRLYRNIKDWATLDELGVTIHFVKEDVVIGPKSRSSDQFVHGIKVLMARNYSLNLGEETIKGMLEKARAGIYPSNAPVGYRNIDGSAGKRIIVPDPDTAPVITDLFRRFATGTYSIKALVSELRTEGVTLRGRRLCSSTTHQILRKRLYTGDFDWDGTTYQGTHEPLVSRECWRRVQELLDARAENKTRKVKHDFAFTGLVRCGHCGCLLVGELKKGKYVYYHCTGNRGKCPEPYTRQETLTGQFGDILRDLVIPQPILAWLGDAVLESDRTEQAAREQAIKRLHARHEQAQARIETMYRDRLDGRIDAEFFDSHAAEWRREQKAILARICDIQRAAPASIDQAIDMLHLTSRASELFLKQPAHEQRHLLGVVMEKADWKDGTLRTTLFEPFEVLRRSNRESHRKENENAGSGRDLEVWLLR
ncbi:MAG TPA: recombinase family protein [Bryobacteraceae bacterium]|nr:recombinase family protein [Bryobacteraceae bacterium]